MRDYITAFTGEYRFLSNFWEVDILIPPFLYKSVEAAYQASKTHDIADKLKISKFEKPAIAKNYGEMVDIQEDWEDIKLNIMKNLLDQKFTYPDLRRMLLSTGDKHLVEGNYWGDIYWGVCKDVGENHLGLLLMEVREEIKQK